MRKDWEVKKLGESCLSIKDGSHNPPKGIESGSYLMLSSQNIQDGYIDFKNSRFISEDDFRKEQKRVKVKKGDLLLTIVGTIGRSCVFDGSFDNIVFQRSVAVLTPKVNIVPFFLRYFIKSKKTLLENEAKGVAQKGIYLKQLSDFKISVPPLQIQQQIVEELDSLTSIIEKQKKQLEELDNLAQSIFYDMFGNPIENEKGWDKIKLVNVCKNKGTYGAGSSSIPKVLDRPRYIRITDILETGELNDDYVVSSNIEDDANYLLTEGDILFARSGATVGKTYLYRGREAQIYAGYLIKFSLNQKYVDPLFVFYITKSNDYKIWLQRQFVGVAQPNINAQKYGNLPISLPPLPLQQQFAAKIEAIEKQKELIKKSIKETEELFNSRMDYYFN